MFSFWWAGGLFDVNIDTVAFDPQLFLFNNAGQGIQVTFVNSN